MKAMQDKIIAIITNMVLSLAIIVVASTMGSDVTGKDEGEQNKLENVYDNEAEVNVSLLEKDELFVGVAIEDADSEEKAEEVVDAETDVTGTGELFKDVCNVEDFVNVPVRVINKSKYEDMFLVNVSEFLNVRAEANAESEVVGKIFAGQGGEVIWQGDTWSLIRSGNVEGYILNEYAWFGSDVEEHVASKAQLFAVVDTDKLRVRNKATKNSATLGMVVQGDKLEIVELGDEWTKVIFEQASAYVATDYIKTEHIIGTGMTIEEEQEAIRAEQERQAAIKAEEERKKKEAEEALEKAIKNSGFAQIVQTSAYSLSEEDAYLMACCVSAEVGSSSYECQLAVANVILNRLKGGYYGNSVRNVIYAKNQFSVAKNGSMDKYIKNGPKPMAVKAVKDALAGNNNMVGFTNFIYLPCADFSKYSEYIIIGSEVFYRR
ncbi:MAG: SH3 domain-containing protein [Lachnospiraceae bacterium]|nr:SH3 domain-containing protein [Lachnospiraceae bacterium]